MMMTKKNNIDVFSFRLFSLRPLPVPIWSKDGHPVQPSERVSQGNFGKSLIIKHVQFEDKGSYTCEASNGVGEAMTYSINLKVMGNII